MTIGYNSDRVSVQKFTKQVLHCTASGFSVWTPSDNTNYNKSRLSTVGKAFLLAEGRRQLRGTILQQTKMKGGSGETLGVQWWTAKRSPLSNKVVRLCDRRQTDGLTDNPLSLVDIFRSVHEIKLMQLEIVAALLAAGVKASIATVAGSSVDSDKVLIATALSPKTITILVVVWDCKWWPNRSQLAVLRYDGHSVYRCLM